MQSNRDIYFELLKNKNKYLTEYVIKLLLCKYGGYNNFTDLSLNFDEINNNSELIYQKSKEIISGVPFQYVMNEAYFLNDNYYVDENVLIPRQETEQLIVEITKKIQDLQSFCPEYICDLCTGSGVLAIEIKKRFPLAHVVATDVNEKVLNIARKNAKNKEKHITFEQGSIVEPLIGKYRFDVLISNPPYIEDEIGVDQQVIKYEPHIALFAKPGTYFYEIIFKNVNNIMKDKFLLGFEIGEDQVEKLKSLIDIYLKNVSYEFKIDLYNKPRFLLIWNF